MHPKSNLDIVFIYILGGGHVNAMNEQSLGGKPGGGNEKPVLDGDVNKDDSKKK